MNDQLQKFQELLTAANSILVTIPDGSHQDVVAAALALYLSLTESGKTAAIAASSAPVVRDSHLVGLDKITSSVGGNNLVITLNVPEDAIDKVTSNTEGGHLNLVIQPQKGRAPLTAQDVTFSTSGASADLIIVVGAADLKDVGALAEKEYELFAPEKIINLSHQVGSFGAVNLTDPSASCSELVTALLQELHLPLDVDIANNLMLGIESATDGLSSPNMTADTFEALAVLYRTGARRSPVKSNTPAAEIVSDVPIVHEDTSTKSTPSAPADDAQPDWLKPKIFKGSSVK